MKKRGAVASGHPETSRAAAAVLEEGGNAFDAALAGIFMACVSEPVLASLGGGGFLMARPDQGTHQGKTILYDCFPQTPVSRRRSSDIDFTPILADFGPTQQEFHIGMGSIATPGLLKGLFEAHRDLGYMPMRRIVEPAVNLAREGVRLNARQAYMVGVVGAILRSRPASLAMYGSRDHPGALMGEGELFSMPDFADTLEILAIEGDGLFYRGEIAKQIADDCEREDGGHLTLRDLERYRCERRAPLTLEIFGSRIHLNPPPSTGGILIAFALELLRDGDVETLGFGSERYLSRIARVMELTNQARIENRLHELDADAMSKSLLDARLLETYRRGLLGRPVAPRGTTHISVVDGAGNAASLSVSNGEGSGYVVPDTGIMLNNVLGEEDINPHGFHLWPLDTRMASMMAPTLVFDTAGALTALGSGGSNRIRTAILQVLLNLIVFRMSPDAAVSAPRIHVEDEKISVEPGYEQGEIDALTRDRPNVDLWDETNMFFGGVHTARRDANGVVAGAGDERRGGGVEIA